MPVRFEAGILRRHATIEAIQGADGVQRAADIADQANTREYIERSFLNTPSLVYHEKLPSESQIIVMEPTGKYAEKAFLIMALGPDTLKNDIVPTEQIYDFPKDVQHAYWKKAVTIMQELNKDKDERSVVAATENNMRERTNRFRRLPRTMGPPHMQIICLNLDDIEPNPEGNPDHLLEEQQELRTLVTTLAFPKRIEDGMKALLGENSPAVTAHLESPVGYSFEVAPAEDIHQITQTMAAHHETYSEHAKRWFEAQMPERQNKLIPQPSYRLYLTLENGKIVATISPALTSYAAVMEAADVVLLRSRETPPRLPPEELAALRARVTQALAGTV